MSDSRNIELEVEVIGSPEEVWQAIATAPGISSWYVPHTVEEREGGAATAAFGDAPEMVIPGRVAAWEPPRRIVFDGGEEGPWIVTVAQTLVEDLASAGPTRLAQAAREWSGTTTPAVSPQALVAALLSLGALAARAADERLGMYCWTSLTD